MALAHYRHACDVGRGGLFFSIARGKVAEGIDFQGHYGNCVVMIGIPYRYTLDRVLRARMAYLHERFGISNRDYLNFDAIRQAAQCAGRVIRDKGDYGMQLCLFRFDPCVVGLMVFADKRYGRMDKHSKLPVWIRQYLKTSHLNLSTDMMIVVSKMFVRRMGQPFEQEEREQSLLTEVQIRTLEQEKDRMDMDL